MLKESFNKNKLEKPKFSFFEGWNPWEWLKARIQRKWWLKMANGVLFTSEKKKLIAFLFGRLKKRLLRKINDLNNIFGPERFEANPKIAKFYRRKFYNEGKLRRRYFQRTNCFAKCTFWAIKFETNSKNRKFYRKNA